MAGSAAGADRRSRGRIEALASGALRVVVYAGIDPTVTPAPSHTLRPIVTGDGIMSARRLGVDAGVEGCQGAAGADERAVPDSDPPVSWKERHPLLMKTS